MIGFNRAEKPRHALVPHTTVVNQPAVCFIPIEAIDLAICSTDGKVLCKLSVSDEMVSMRCIVPLNRERRIARPVATLVHSTAVDAPGTTPCERDASGYSGKQKQRWCDEPSHPRTPRPLWTPCRSAGGCIPLG